MKREKTIRLSILIASILIFFSLAIELDFGQSNKYKDILIDYDTYQSIIEKRKLKDDISIPEIYFDDFKAPLDINTGNFLYSLIEDSDSKFNPKINSISSNFTRYDIAIYGDILNEDSIKGNEQAKIIIYDDDEYKEFTLSATTLPIITINMNEISEDKDNPISLTDSMAQFELFDNRKDISFSERIVKSQTYIRLRGATSLQFPKNQFRLNLREFSIGGDESNNHLSLLDLREDDDWILYSAYNDPEKMRNTLSNNLWHETMGTNNPFNINTGTKGTFVEVFIDDIYWGVYTLMFPIDAKQLDLSLNSSETSDFYYRTFGHNEFVVDEFVDFKEGNIRGRFELRDPESTGLANQWNPLVEHMLSLNFEEDELIDYINKNSYLPNLVDYYLFFILLQATDNNTKNHNYIAKYTSQGHLMLESPWDLDLTWGLHWTPESPRLASVRGDSSKHYIPSISHVNQGVKLGSDTIISATRERYIELRQNEWSEERFMERLDEFESMIYDSGAILRDYERWPTSAFNENTEELRNYILERLQYTDNLLEDMLGGELQLE